MQKFKFFKQGLTKVQNFLRKSLGILFSFDIVKIFIGFSHLDKYLRLPFFDGQVRNGYFADMQKPVSAALPSKNLFSTISRHLVGCIFTSKSSEGIVYPIYKDFIGRSYRNIDLVMFIPGLFAATIIPYCKTSFSVKNSCHVSSGCFRIFFSSVVTASRHFVLNVSAFVNHIIKTINLQSERLNSEDFFSIEKRYAIV